MNLQPTPTVSQSHEDRCSALSRDRWKGNMKAGPYFSAGLPSRIWKTSSKASPLWSLQLMSVSKEGPATWKQHRLSTTDQKDGSEVPHSRHLQDCGRGEPGGAVRTRRNSCGHTCPSRSPQNRLPLHYIKAKGGFEVKVNLIINSKLSGAKHKRAH